MSDVRQPFAFGPSLIHFGNVPFIIFRLIVDALIFSIITSSASLNINRSSISAPCPNVLSVVMIAHGLQVTIFLWRYFFLDIARKSPARTGPKTGPIRKY